MKATSVPARTASGARHQKRPLHVDVWTNAAARKGPIAFPPPTQDPKIPWYLKIVSVTAIKTFRFTHFPRFSKVTTSDTIIIVRAVIPPLPTPAIPLKAYSCGPVFEKEHSKSPNAKSATADKKTPLRPRISESRPYRTWKTVFAIKLEVPAHAIVVAQFRSFPIVGRAIPMEFWSINAMRRAEARPQNTTISFAFGRMFVSMRTNSFDIMIACLKERI